MEQKILRLFYSFDFFLFQSIQDEDQDFANVLRSQNNRTQWSKRFLNSFFDDVRYKKKTKKNIEVSLSGL